MSEKLTKSFSRKDFLKTAGSGVILAYFGISLTSCSSNVTDASSSTNFDTSDPNSPITINGNVITVDLSRSELEELNKAGGWLLIRDAQTLLVNIDGTFFRAFTSVCTHQNCSVNWQFDGSNFICTCHNSKFDTSGAVTQGPATRDLEEFEVEREGNTLTITK